MEWSKDENVRKSGGPPNLFQRVLMQTRKQRSKPKNVSEIKETEPAIASDTSSGLDKDAANAEGFCPGYADKLVELVLHGKGTMREKINALKAFGEYSTNDAAILQRVVSKEVISFCENLLINFCDRSQVTEEVKLLIPFLSFLLTYTNSIDVKLFESLMVRQSDFMYQLMRACVMCVDTMLSKSEELIKLTRKKKLAGRVRKLAEEDPTTKLTRLLGISTMSSQEYEVPKGVLLIESYNVTLFDTTSSVTDKNINEHVTSMYNPKLIDSSSDFHSALGLKGISQCLKEPESNEQVWTDTVVANVLPFGELLAYTKGDWSYWLQLINGGLVEFLRDMKSKSGESGYNVDVKIGSIVGFWSTDVKFRWKPLMMMQCFRGIVLGKANCESVDGSNDVSWAVWAMDVGTLGFGSKVCLLNQDTSSIAPLVSICHLEMEEGGNNGESLFLLVALKLLAKLLATNPTAGRHMVAFGFRKFDYACDIFNEDGKTCEGGVFLKLISYPEIEIRLEFLKLIILLARSSSEILRYLIECRFYLAIYSRLEVCVHFCHTLSSDDPLWSEIRLQVMLLSSMSEGSEMNLTELPGWNRIEKVLLMLTKFDNHTYVPYMAAKCLVSMGSHKSTVSKAGQTTKFTSPGRRSSNGRRANQSGGDATAHNKETRKPSSSAGNQRMQRNNSREFSPDTFFTENSETPKPLLSVFDGGDSSSSDEGALNLPPVDAVADMARQMERYIKGYRVTICNDQTHELSLEKYGGQISENSLALTACAFLNNGVGGSVYFGINAKGIIEGVKMTRIQRDNFRKGVDRMMTRSIYPEVRPACYDVLFIPVHGPGEVFQGHALHGLWVIEVHVKALPHVIYAVSSNRKCYVRKGSQCVESMSICLRQEAAEQNKKEILQAIADVKAKIPETKEKLMVFIKDYLEESKNIV